MAQPCAMVYCVITAVVTPRSALCTGDVGRPVTPTCHLGACGSNRCSMLLMMFKYRNTYSNDNTPTCQACNRYSNDNTCPPARHAIGIAATTPAHLPGALELGLHLIHAVAVAGAAQVVGQHKGVLDAEQVALRADTGGPGGLETSGGWTGRAGGKHGMSAGGRSGGACILRFLLSHDDRIPPHQLLSQAECKADMLDSTCEGCATCFRLSSSHTHTPTHPGHHSPALHGFGHQAAAADADHLVAVVMQGGVVQEEGAQQRPQALAVAAAPPSQPHRGVAVGAAPFA